MPPMLIAEHRRCNRRRAISRSARGKTVLLLPIMPSAPGMPVIFISYSHKDEPAQPQPGEVRWLSEIQSYLSPALKHGFSATYELWDDRQIAGGKKWRAEIEAKLAACTVCILLLSRHSLDSDFVIKVEVETIQERQRHGENVLLFPIVLSRF